MGGDLGDCVKHAAACLAQWRINTANKEGVPTLEDQGWGVVASMIAKDQGASLLEANRFLLSSDVTNPAALYWFPHNEFRRALCPVSIR